jgi:valyl-tRNA synthetase
MVCEGVDGPPQEVQDNPSDYVQDEDVLDTWFSSALWPFSSLGWPDNTLYVDKFYPNSTLVTGHDILFFWVARMMALGTHVMKKPPFPQVFLHGLIFGKSYFTQDQGGGVTYIKGEQKERYDRGEPLPKGVKYKWEKMSKSKGNVLDPIELMDEYGTDAIRMALVMCASQSRQIDLDRRKFEEYKNFANKLWNGARFVFMNLEGLDANKLNEASHDPSLADRWILTELSKSLQTASKAVNEYFFDKAASALTDFFWNDFCAYYLELSKPILSGKKGSPGERLLKQKILISVLMQIVAALHPFIPFVTESLFGKIKQALGQFQKTTDPLLIHFAACMNSPTLAQSPYPQSTFFDLQAADEFVSIIEYLHQIRELRGELQIPPSEPVTVYLENACDLIKTHLPLLEAMTKLKEVHFTKVPSSMIVGTKTIQNATISILLPQSLIFKEIERLEKDLLKTGTEIANLKIKLANSEFVAKAPPQIVAKLELSLAQYQQTQLTLQTKLNHYKASY